MNSGSQNLMEQRLFQDAFDGLALNAAWNITDTSSGGTPTKAPAAGGLLLQFAATSEIENLCVDFGDALTFDIDNLQYIRFKLSCTAALDSATSLAFGLSSERNDAIDTIAEMAALRCIGSNVLVAETDDGTVNNDDVATGRSLGATPIECSISFTHGKSDVRFYVDDMRVAAATTFDMSNYSGGLQPFVQLQKTADTNTDQVLIRAIEVLCKNG